MSFDLQKILESKRTFRRKLAERPIAEKLGILDTLREREMAIRGQTHRPTSATTLRETPAPYRTKTQ